MEHAIFYPWLKDNSFDLYSIGNERLANFLRNELTSLYNKYSANKYQVDKVTLILNYVKFHVEADNYNLQKRLEDAYSKEMLVEMRDVAQRLLPIILTLKNQEPNPKCFKQKYYEVLRAMGINEHFWPEFMRF